MDIVKHYYKVYTVTQIRAVIDVKNNVISVIDLLINLYFLKLIVGANVLIKKMGNISVLLPVKVKFVPDYVFFK